MPGIKHSNLFGRIYSRFLLLWCNYAIAIVIIAIIDLYLVLKSVDKVFESLLYRKVMATMDSHFYYKIATYRKQHCGETL